MQPFFIATTGSKKTNENFFNCLNGSLLQRQAVLVFPSISVFMAVFDLKFQNGTGACVTKQHKTQKAKELR